MTKLNPALISKEDAVIKALVTDLAWGFKELIFPSRYLTELIEVWIAYDWSSFRWVNHINKSDAILQWVEETLVKIPANMCDIQKPEYWIICNILDEKTKKPHSSCSRSKLVEMQELLAKEWNWGVLYMGSEPEAFFIEKRNNIWNREGWNTNYFNPKDPKARIITEIQAALDEMWYQIERAHTEVGEDQFEINWRFDKAEFTADKIQIYKLMVHKIASLHWYDVTFLPKPYPSRNGSWMHCHISVQNQTDNLFYDMNNKDKHFFSDKALCFLTGILDNARSLAAIANSTEVSYSRLVPWFEAPCVIAIWSCNRSAACRIPAIANSDLIKKAIRTEFRFPDPLANPYLLAAAFIAVWLAGVKNKAKFKGFTDEDLYAFSVKELRSKWFDLLPRNLWEAYNEFVNNKILKEYLWGGICDSYADVILDEIDVCQPFANQESMRRHYFA